MTRRQIVLFCFILLICPTLGLWTYELTRPYIFEPIKLKVEENRKLQKEKECREVLGAKS